MADENYNLDPNNPASSQGAPQEQFQPPQNVPQPPQPTQPQYQPLQTAPQPQYQQAEFVQTQNQKQANSAATISLVCGIICLFLFGLILGIIAIVQSNRAKQLGYKGGKATAGLVLGVIGIVGWAIIIFANFL